MASGLVDIEVIVVRRTAAAVLVKDDEDARPVWLPLSEIECDPPLETSPTGGLFAGTTTVTLPEWLAQERGLI